MYIGELRDYLEQFPKDRVCKSAFKDPHSFRGYYDEAAVVPCKNEGITVGDMLNTIDRLLSETFVGYKGGDFNYTKHHEIHFSHYGFATDLELEMLEILMSIAGINVDIVPDIKVYTSW